MVRSLRPRTAGADEQPVARVPRRIVPLVRIAAVILSAIAVSETHVSLQPIAVNPATTLWYAHPVEKWQDALPLGNGRLGVMAFGRTDEEPLQINEDTYWTGGPYSTTVPGARAALPAVRDAIFAGDLIRAHKLFNRHLLGRPVEQQKYQALGHIVLTFPGRGAATEYRHCLLYTSPSPRDGLLSRMPSSA